MPRRLGGLADVDGSKSKERNTLCIDPLGIEVGQGRLVTQLLERLGRLLVDQTAAATATGLFGVEGHGGGVGGGGVELTGPRIGSQAEGRSAVEECG